MLTKYNTEISDDIIINNLKRIINQTYKLLPNREEGIDWETPLMTIIEECAGMNRLFENEWGEDYLTLLCKMEGLLTLTDKEDFFNFRRTIFECLSLMNGIKSNVIRESK